MKICNLFFIQLKGSLCMHNCSALDALRNINNQILFKFVIISTIFLYPLKGIYCGMLNVLELIVFDCYGYSRLDTKTDLGVLRLNYVNYPLDDLCINLLMTNMKN